MKPKTRLRPAMILAEQLQKELLIGCERCEIAGSVRRHVSHVSDIEFVIVTKRQKDLFGNPGLSQLEVVLNKLESERTLRRIAGGEKLRRYQLQYDHPEDQPPKISQWGQYRINVELYIVPRANLGYQLAIRTGPAEVSQKMVTQRLKGGWLDDHCKCHEGRVLSVVAGGSEPLFLPEEKDFFELLSVNYCDPEQRSALLQAGRR